MKTHFRSGRSYQNFFKFQRLRTIPLVLSLSLICFLSDCKPSPITSSSHNGECIFLLHGLARSSRSLKKMEKYLLSEGYQVINLDYPSTDYSIPELAVRYLKPAVQERVRSTKDTIHFVTHSMGGIVVRYFLNQFELPQLGRVVMLSPPNQGTELVDFYKKRRLFKKTHGPAGQQLGTEEGSLPIELGPVNFELGIISGNRSFYFYNSTLIPGPDDGIVSVERTKVEGMADFLLLPYSHPFIIKKDTVLEQVVVFLKSGQFSHAGGKP